MKKLLLTFFLLFGTLSATETQHNEEVGTTEHHLTDPYTPKTMVEMFESFLESTGIYAFTHAEDGTKIDHGHEIEVSQFSQSWGRIIMILITFLLFYLAIVKNFEPLLLMPIGFGGLLANIPIAEIAGPDGFL